MIVAGVLLGAGSTMALIGAASAVSVSIVAAMLSASVVLIGVVITNAAHSDRQAQQLAHDREQQGIQLEHDRHSTRIQREVEHKKALYVDASSAANQVVSDFIDFRDPRLATADISRRLRASAEPIAKLMVVADEETHKHSQAFLNAMQVAVTNIYDSHAELTKSWDAVQSLKTKAEKANNFTEADLSKMTAATGHLSTKLDEHNAPFEALLDPLVEASRALKDSLRREVTGLLTVAARIPLKS